MAQNNSNEGDDKGMGIDISLDQISGDIDEIFITGFMTNPTVKYYVIDNGPE